MVEKPPRGTSFSIFRRLALTPPFALHSALDFILGKRSVNTIGTASKYVSRVVTPDFLKVIAFSITCSFVIVGFPFVLVYGASS